MDKDRPWRKVSRRMAWAWSQNPLPNYEIRASIQTVFLVSPIRGALFFWFQLGILPQQSHLENSSEGLPFGDPTRVLPSEGFSESLSLSFQ